MIRPANNSIIVPVRIEGSWAVALVDSGCSVSLVKTALVIGKKWSDNRHDAPLITMSSQKLKTKGWVRIGSLRHGSTELGPTEAKVVETLSFDVDVIIGLPIMLRHGLWIGVKDGKSELVWGGSAAAFERVDRDKERKIQDRDFMAEFRDGAWAVQWNWRHEPAVDSRRVVYKVPDDVVEEFDKEIETWISEGILVKYKPQVHGPIKHYVPMMRIRQHKGDATKVRPVLDFRKLNETIESHPGGAMPLCSERLREWRQRSQRCSILDLRRAYLQVRVHRSQWAHQAVCWHGKTYLLTRLAFGLSSAPKIMTSIVRDVLEMKQKIKAGVSSYIDDLYVDEEIVDAETVGEHLRKWGLVCKDPQRIAES